MITKKMITGLVMGLVLSFCYSASADQLIQDDLIVAPNDGTAPAYDCSEGATLPFDPIEWTFDSSSVTETIPPGEPIIAIKFNGVCDFSSTPWICEYTCYTASSVCVGFDCINGESFDGDTLRLKENNTRIRFHNTSIGDVLGESWNIEANSSRNGGPSYFDFQVKSVEKDTVVISDGTYWPLYDCTETNLDPSIPPTQVMDENCPGAPGCAERGNRALIPAGQPVIEVKTECSTVNQQYVCEYECVEKLEYTVKSVFTLGTAGNNPAFNNGVAIGYESASEDGVISVGRADLARRIVRVAAGINGTDALTGEGLNIEKVALLAQQIARANEELDEIEARIEQIEVWQQLFGTINGMYDSAFRNKNMKKALINKINAVLAMLDEGQYQGALNNLQHDILSKTNGCAETGSPDNNDWLADCQAQDEVYPLILEEIARLQNLV
jgi:hypothetical protein